MRWKLPCPIVALLAASGGSLCACSNAGTPAPLEAADASVPAAPPEAADGPCRDTGVWVPGLVVSNQGQLDQLEGCERMASDFTLQLFDGIDESPLLSLRQVDGILTVYGAEEPSARDLDGFASLEQVGVQLTLSGLSLVDLKPFGHLRRIGTEGRPNVGVLDWGMPRTLEVTNCTGLTSLAGLDALVQIDQVTLTGDPDLMSVAGLSQITQLDGLSVQDCPLTDLRGVEPLSVQRLSLSGTALTSLEGLGNAAALKQLSLKSNASLVSLEGGTLPTQMDEVALESQDALTDLKGLEGLQDLTTLSIVGNDAVVLVADDAALHTGIASLSGLEGLERIGSLKLDQLPRLAHLTGLDALQSVDQFEMTENPGLLDLSGMPKLQQVGTLALSADNALTSLQGLGSASIGTLSLNFLPITTLAGIEHVNLGGLEIYEDLALSSLAGLPPLSATSTISIQGAGLSGLPELSTLTALGSLRLYETEIVDLSGLSNLTQLGSLALQENHLLQHGPPLPLLTQADSITVVGNNVLADLSGSSALQTVQQLSVSYNPLLTQVQLPKLASGGTLFIEQNQALDDTPLEPLRQLPFKEVKIVSNLSGPGLLSPCPWPDDGECDVSIGNCAPGTEDADDCCKRIESGMRQCQ